LPELPGQRMLTATAADYQNFQKITPKNDGGLFNHWPVWRDVTVPGTPSIRLCLSASVVTLRG
jgi:hypothetical protein